VNNNYKLREKLKTEISKLNLTFHLDIVNNNENVGGRGRFIEAVKTTSKYCVFLDDDQIVDENLLALMESTASEQTICSWWAWKFTDSYWNRTRSVDGHDATYCGTGGMIVDSTLFLDNKFWDGWNPKYYFVEDLYASLYARSIGWSLKGHKYPIQFDETLADDSNSLYLKSDVNARKQELITEFNNKMNSMEDKFSEQYWERRYKSGGNSGGGSYGNGLVNKVELITDLMEKYDIKSIADVGCGDCTIVPKLPHLESYVGYDISSTIIDRHNSKNTNPSYKYKLISELESLGLDLSLSLEVIFHQVNDEEYIEYMDNLVKTDSFYILILTMNDSILDTHHVKAAHIKYRDVVNKMSQYPNYELIGTFPFTVTTSSYYLYKKL